MKRCRKKMVIPVAGTVLVLFLAGCTPGKAQTRGNDYRGSFHTESFETFDARGGNQDQIPSHNRGTQVQGQSDFNRHDQNVRSSGNDFYSRPDQVNNQGNQGNFQQGHNQQRNFQPHQQDNFQQGGFQQGNVQGGGHVHSGFVAEPVNRNEFREDRFFQTGAASWYGREFHGKTTASGETFDMNQLTAAHKTLPFGTIVEVRNLENGRSVRLRINDRGPYRGNRIIDVSHEAARNLDMVRSGEARVGISVISMGDNSTAHNRSAGSSFVEPVSDRGIPANVSRYDAPGRYERPIHSSMDIKLQTGAFYSRRNAEMLRDRVQGMTDKPVRVVQDGDFFKVHVEGLRSRSEAESVRRSLGNANISSFIIE